MTHIEAREHKFAYLSSTRSENETVPFEDTVRILRSPGPGDMMCASNAWETFKREEVEIRSYLRERG